MKLWLTKQLLTRAAWAWFFSVIAFGFLVGPFDVLDTVIAGAAIFSGVGYNLADAIYAIHTFRRYRSGIVSRGEGI